MIFDERMPTGSEQAVFALRGLYRQYGYTQYKMSKFEEYDLYVRNKDFLVGDGVITFTDTDGKLMALKPDVTLSIIKNSKDEPRGMQKVYYNENVYRISRSTHTFKEIMQTGLECIGEIDVYAMAEVVLLALRSLEMISRNSVLDLSHLGVLSALTDGIAVPAEEKKKLIACVGEKNVHGICEICASYGVSESITEKLTALVCVYGKPREVLRKLSALQIEGAEEAIAELAAIISALEAAGVANRLSIDFSVVNDMNYYSGIVFRGFIEGIPDGILSGGRYDKLMKKMGRRTGAIGFAVYLDMLERLNTRKKEYDADIVLVYGDDTDAGDVLRAMALLSGMGKTVLAEKEIPENIRYRELLSFRNGGLEILEKHD